ncbi:hypothetical protein ANCDUO_05925 [Ancylostoma duodenale]|uniref:Uncharacterized protein n=1 Tax=Ancylostoma duodenale TaxID=51022 RepID=A0A0C2GR45_9BILA|nr:hypothetical protein ANCDUO_05925 [Ancylostoma duodenale]
MDSTEEQQPVVRMRGRPLNETNGTNATNGTNGGAQNVLQRGLEALQENCSEETEGELDAATLEHQFSLIASAG